MGIASGGRHKSFIFKLNRMYTLPSFLLEWRRRGYLPSMGHSVCDAVHKVNLKEWQSVYSQP